MKRVIAYNKSGGFLILDRPGEDEFIDEPRADDKAILADTREGVRWPPHLLHSFLAHGNGVWEEFEHDEDLMEKLMALPERTVAA